MTSEQQLLDYLHQQFPATVGHVLLKALIHDVWKQGMSDAADCVRNNPKYAGEYWFPEGIEDKRDNIKSV